MSVIITHRKTGKLIATVSIDKFRQLTNSAGLAAHAVIERFNGLHLANKATLI